MTINIAPEQARYAQQEYGLEGHITNCKNILTNADSASPGSTL